MMDAIHPPIIAVEHGDVLVFEFLKEAADYMEPIDVQANEYVVYDSRGRVLTPEVTSSGQITIKAADLEQRPEELTHALRAYLAQLGPSRTHVPPSHLDALKLDELVDFLVGLGKRRPKR